MQAGVKTEKMCKYFHLQASCDGSINIYAKEVHFLLWILSLWHSHVCLLFTDKKQKKLANDVTCTSATHANLCSWHHIHRMLDTLWQHSQPCICVSQMLIFNKLPDRETREKLQWIYISFSSYYKANDASSLGVPFNVVTWLHALTGSRTMTTCVSFSKLSIY